jgi:hypothetical protein
MTNTTRFAAMMLSAAIAASIGVPAYAKTKNLDAYAQGARHESDDDIRKGCYAEANKRWPTSNQDLQTARQYAYSTCAFEHGVHNP